MSPGDTRTALLDLAEELLRTRSFNAFSYGDLAEGIGIRKASIHHHFPSKEDLGVALIERFKRRGMSWAGRLAEQNASPLEKLDAYFRIQSEVLDRNGMICALGILGAEFNALPERMRESYTEFVEQQLVWLSRLLAKGQKQGVFVEGTDPDDQAAWVQASLVGGLQLARGSARPDRFHAMVKTLRSSLLRDPQTPPSSSEPSSSEPPVWAAESRAR